MNDVILTPEEMKEISIRAEMIARKATELKIISNEKKSFERELLTKYALDPDKKYSIDDRGVIKEENAG